MTKEEALRLVQLYKDGKRESAIEQVYVATLDSVYRFVYSKVGRKNWTEDIVSETYITLIEILDKYNGNSKIETFIIGIARNKIRQFLSKLNTDVSFEEEYIADPSVDSLRGDSVEPGQEEREKPKPLDRSKLTKVLEELSGKYRLVLENRFIHALSIKETAVEMNESEANVRVLQHRAIKKAVEIANTLFAQ